jgi:hypothetical protein
MTTYIYLKEGSDHFLTKCLDQFPIGIPVTTKEPLNDLEVDYKDWARLSLLGKLKASCKELWEGDPMTWILAIEPWLLWAFPKRRLYFYLLDSKALDTNQYQAVRKCFFDFPKEVIIELKKGLERQLGKELEMELTPEAMSHVLMGLALNPNDPLNQLPITLDYISSIKTIGEDEGTHNSP